MTHCFLELEAKKPGPEWQPSRPHVICLVLKFTPAATSSANCFFGGRTGQERRKVPLPPELWSNYERSTGRCDRVGCGQARLVTFPHSGLWAALQVHPPALQQ